MAAGPHVSIIIPFLNASRFLRETVRGVVDQTLADWEIILVDDGSSDSSSAIAAEFVRERPRQVRCVEHDGHRNRGTSASRNLGLVRARGELVAFLDADDVWLPDMLRHHADILGRYPEAAFSYAPGCWWYGWTNRAEDVERDFVQDTGVPPNRLVAAPGLLNLYLHNEAAVPSPSGMVFRRTALTAVDAWDEAFTGMYDDQVLYAKLGLRFPAYVSRECLYLYRQHGGSLCARIVRKGSYLESRERFLVWLLAYLEEYGCACAETRSLVDTRLWYTRLRRRLAAVAGGRAAQARRVSETLAFFGRLAAAKGPLFFCDPTVVWVAKQWVRKDVMPRWDRGPGWLRTLVRSRS